MGTTIAFLGAWAAACLAGCGEQAEVEQPGHTSDDPPTARRDTLDMLRQFRDAERHPSDGGGHAWLDADASDLEIVAARPGHWTVHFEAGPEGVAEGGVVRLIVSPYWHWSPPQTRAPAALGFSRVTTTAEGVTLTVRAPDTSTLEAAIGGRALRPGEVLTFEYGAGTAGARADRFAEEGARLWIAVDGDGDGVHAVLEDSPTVRILAGEARRLIATLPSTLEPGEEGLLRLAFLDGAGNAGCRWSGSVHLRSVPAGLDLPETVELPSGLGGLLAVPIKADRTGVYRVLAGGMPAADGQIEAQPEGAVAQVELLAESNPLEVASGAPRILWGDLHGHSNLSDGTGTPAAWYRYARDVAALDVAALTDHDHWGMLFLDEHADLWKQIQETTRAFHNPGDDPGHFVTLHGYEWTNWIHGHRHVLHFGDGDVPILSSVDETLETPAQLWDALRGQEVLTFAHHSAGGPIATDWDFAPDPVLEPLTEITSVHGSSEAADSPATIQRPLNGNWARDALGRGYRLGFLGSGDGHDGHPGLAHLQGQSGGLAAILSTERTRPAVLAALRARRVYATNGPRILLRTALGGHGMGQTVPASAPGASQLLYIRAVTPAPIERIDVIRGKGVTQTFPGEGAFDLETTLDVADLSSGEFLYVRVIQTDGGAAWSSPFFVE